MAILSMEEDNSSVKEESDQGLGGGPRSGWGSWALSVLALAAVGALS